jgi:hypothetical protein
MPVVSTDIVYRLSGGSANTNPAAALGGAMSTAGGGIVTPGGANNVWDDVTGAESAAGDTEYRCLYVSNANGSVTLQSAVIWIDSATTSADTEFDIGLDPAAVGSDSTTTIANENTAPAGVTFTRPTTKGGGLSIGNIPAGSKKAYWERRTVNAGAAAASDTGSIRVEGDTGP